MTDVRAAIRGGEMTGFQQAAVGICLALNGLDGFDVLAMSFAAPDVGKLWGLKAAGIATLMSAGLVGMTIGSLALAPLADRIGRRAMILLCLVVMSLGMLASGFAHGVTGLSWLRLLTGLGIGGMLASLNAIVAEYASEKRRDLAVAVMSVGYPIGSTIGGVIAAYVLLRVWDWRSIFVFGGLCSLAMIPVVLAALPESIDYLIARKPRGALEKLNAILKRMGRGQVSALPEAETEDRGVAGLLDVFHPSLLRVSIPVSIAYFLGMISMYFVLQWTPKILVDSGFSTKGGITGSVIINLTGIVSGIALGQLSRKWGLARLTALSMVLFFVFNCLFGIAHGVLNLAILAGLIGIGLYGMVVGLYAIAAAAYPAHVRATGSGMAIGFGRFGAILSPYCVSYFIDGGWDRSIYFTILSIPLLIGAVAILMLPRLGTTKAA